MAKKIEPAKPQPKKTTKTSSSVPSKPVSAGKGNVTTKGATTEKSVKAPSTPKAKAPTASSAKGGMLAKAATLPKGTSLENSKAKAPVKVPVPKKPVAASKAVKETKVSKPADTNVAQAKKMPTKKAVLSGVVKVEKPAKQKKEKKPKKPKGRVRIVPLIIVAAIITGGIVFVNLFLNPIIKNGIQSAMENAFEARCDIEYVDLRLGSASFEIGSLAQANNASPMQNLFEFSRISLDFDLTQLLLGRFVVDEVSVVDFKIGTERATSGELTRIIKQPEPKADTKEGKFASAIDTTISSVNTNAKNVIEQAIETYNPENMLTSYIEKLKIPSLIGTSEETVQEITTYWVNAAPGLEKSGQDLFNSVDDIRTLLETDTVDVGAIRDGIASIQSLVSKGEALQAQVNDATTRLDADINTIDTLTSQIELAIEEDLTLIENEIKQITSLSFADAQGMVSSTIEGFIIGALGDYFPFVQKGLQMLSNAKADAQEQKREEEKRSLERMHGRTVYFNAEMPSFLIRNVIFSGADSGDWLAVSGYAHDISNNPDLLGKPAVSSFEVSLAAFNGSLDTIVDLRSETEHAPVEAVFNATGFDTGFLNNTEIVGVPNIGGDASIRSEATFGLDGDFDILANFTFDPALLSTTQFEPASVYDVYANILQAIQDFYIQTTILYSLDEGINLGIETDVDKKITDGLSEALNAEIEALKENLQGEAEEYLARYTDTFMENITDFGSSRDSILSLQDGLGGFDAEMNSLKKELESRLTEQAAGAIQDNLGEEASRVLDNFF